MTPGWAMRIFAIILYVISAVGLVLSGLWYVGIQGYACGLGNLHDCPTKWPWELRGEDFIFLTGPFLIFAALILIARLVQRRS